MAAVAGRSSGRFKVHLAVASTGHGVFKGVMKCRKTPEERKKWREILDASARRDAAWLRSGGGEFG